MGRIIIYLLLYLFIIFYDLVPIKKNGYNKLFAFNLITMCVAFIIVVLVGFNLKVPSPANFIEDIVNLFIK
ncbi:MAG TPA: hypothetical protein VFC98_05665 [Clostridia bacterium]|nr:hypothetical protein [Clostridia bacterium]